MIKQEVGSTIYSNMAWRFAERCGAQGISLIVSVVLARLLDPQFYGTIALVTVFLSVLQVFVDSGMGNALIQKKDADNLDFSTVFYFNLVVCILLYLAMFAAAPLIARFYNDNSLIAIIRVISLTLVVSGVKNIQQAYVSRNLLFKRFFFATIGGTLISACAGIIMAYMGYGIWALVVQQLSNSVIDTIVLWLTVRWRPQKIFSWSRFQRLFSYGSKLLLASLVRTACDDLYQLIIGKMYTSSELAYFNRGKQIPALVVTNINTSIDGVLLPVMSNCQDGKQEIKQMMRRAIQLSTYLIAPMMMGLAFAAPSFVEVVLTSKWMPCVPYFRIFCVLYMFYPIATVNLNAINALGRSDLFLKLEILKKSVGLLLLIVTMRYGALAIAYGQLLSGLICQLINAGPNKKLLEYGYWEQIKDMLSSVILAVFMGICVGCVAFLQWSSLLILVTQISIGIIIYIGASIIFKLDSFVYLVNLVKTFRVRKNMGNNNRKSSRRF